MAGSKKLLGFVLEESVDRRERYWLAGEDEGGSVANLCTDLELFSFLFLLAIDVHMDKLSSFSFLSFDTSRMSHGGLCVLAREVLGALRDRFGGYARFPLRGTSICVKSQYD